MIPESALKTVILKEFVDIVEIKVLEDIVQDIVRFDFFLVKRDAFFIHL